MQYILCASGFSAFLTEYHWEFLHYRQQTGRFCEQMPCFPNGLPMKKGAEVFCIWWLILKMSPFAADFQCFFYYIKQLSERIQTSGNALSAVQLPSDGNIASSSRHSGCYVVGIGVFGDVLLFRRKRQHNVVLYCLFPPCFAVPVFSRSRRFFRRAAAFPFAAQTVTAVFYVTDKKRAFPVTKKVFSRVPVPEKDGEKSTVRMQKSALARAYSRLFRNSKPVNPECCTKFRHAHQVHPP